MLTPSGSVTGVEDVNVAVGRYTFFFDEVLAAASALASVGHGRVTLPSAFGTQLLWKGTGLGHGVSGYDGSTNCPVLAVAPGTPSQSRSAVGDVSGSGP